MSEKPDWKKIAEDGREGLEGLAEGELKRIAKEEGIDDSLDTEDIIGLILKAADTHKPKEKRALAKNASISAALTLLQANPKSTVGVISTTVVAVAAVLLWYFL